MAHPRWRSITTGTAVLLGLAIIVIGVRFVVAPAAAASDFGVPAGPTDDAYLAAKGVRDVATGVIGLTLIALGHRRAVGWLLALVALVPLSDAVIVLTHGGAVGVALGIHGATAAVLIAIGVAFLGQSAARRTARPSRSELFDRE